MLKSIAKLNELEEKYELDGAQVLGIFYANMETLIMLGHEHQVREGMRAVLSTVPSYQRLLGEQAEAFVDDVVEQFRLLYEDMAATQEKRAVEDALNELHGKGEAA